MLFQNFMKDTYSIRSHLLLIVFFLYPFQPFDKTDRKLETIIR